jgi:hypothetical protein
MEEKRRLPPHELLPLLPAVLPRLPLPPAAGPAAAAPELGQGRWRHCLLLLRLLLRAQVRWRQ